VTVKQVYFRMGELHLDILVDRMVASLQVEGKPLEKPQVSYREKIRQRGGGLIHKFVRQSGGRVNTVHVVK